MIATDESIRVSSSTAIAYETRVGAGAAVLLGNRHPHQPELGQLRDELVREAVLAVELLGDRGDPLLRELAHGGADEFVLRVRSRSTRPGMLSDGLLGCGCGFHRPLPDPLTMPIPTLMRSATREPSVERSARGSQTASGSVSAWSRGG